MMQIKLICMPFYTLDTPSIALTQIKTVLDEQFSDCASTEICYCNHDFSKFLGKEIYEYFLNEKSVETGVGDWLFRQLAFSNVKDNTKSYFNRYGYKLKELVSKKDEIEIFKGKLDVFLDYLIDKYNLLKADLIGFTSVFSQNVPSFALAKRIKERNASVVITMGGSNCEYPMGYEIIKNIKDVDFVFSGESLINFPLFITNLLNKGNYSAPT